MSLLEQRRKRMEVAGKVGVPPQHLVPQQQSSYPPFPTNAQNFNQQQQHQQLQEQQLHHENYGVPSYAAPPVQQQLSSPAANFAAGGVAPPNFSGDYLLPPSYSVAPPQREVRSAGHNAPPVNVHAAYGNVPSSPQRLPDVTSQAPAQVFAAQPPVVPEAPQFGRRAHTSDVDTRDRAKLERQAEYQREIARQAEEARERKRLEKEKQRKEDEAFELRVQQERQRIGEQEQREREKEVRDRDEREAASVGGKRRGGNNPPPPSNVTDLQKDLQRQIEENRKRKEEEDNRKRLEDEQYEQKFAARSHAAGNLHRQPSLGGATSSLPWESAPPPPAAPSPPPAAPPTTLPFRQSEVDSLAAMKDDIFSMLADQHRLRSMQQQQSLFPPPQGGFQVSPYGASQWPPHAQSSWNANQSVPVGPSPALSGAFHAGPPMPSSFSGQVGSSAAWGQPSALGAPPGLYPPFTSALPNSSAPQAPLPGYNFAPATNYNAPLSSPSMTPHMNPQQILQRFMEDGQRTGGGIYSVQPLPTAPSFATAGPSDDVSMELPSSEPTKFLGNRQRRY